MPDKVYPVLLMILAAIAAGLGNLMAGNEQLTWRKVLGRAISSGALGLAAGTILIKYPDIHPIGLCGLAALLGSFGTSGMERVIQKIFWRT